MAKLWVVLMLLLVFTSFDIRIANEGQPSPIHGFSFIILVLIILEIWGAYRGQITLHRYSMLSSFCILILVLVALVVIPGGVLNQWFIG